MKIGKSKTKAQATAGSIRVAQGTYQKAILKKLITQLLIAMFALILVYFCFAATIVRFVPSSSGVVLTKNNTYPGGDLPKNSQVLVSLNPEVPVDRTMTGRLKLSVIPQKPSAVVSVQAGPIGKVKWTGGVLSVNGKALPATFPEDPMIAYLDNQYIAVCIKGDCTPGTPIIFKPEQLIGVLLGQNQDIPTAPPANSSAGPDRTNPEQVVQGYLVESYLSNPDLACGLLTPSALQEMGGLGGCKTEGQLLGTKLGGNYDFGAGMITKLSTSDDKQASVDYTLLREGEEIVSGTATLEKGKLGWSIDRLTEK